MPKRTARDYSQILIVSAILVTVARYIGAFLASDLGEITGWVSTGITILMGLTGVGMGILDVLGCAYIFDGWRKNMPKAGNKPSNRFKVETGFVMALFLVGIFILVPFTMSRVYHESMAVTLGYGLRGWLWSIAVNLAPYLLIGGVVVSNTNVVGVTKAETEQVTGNLPQVTSTGMESFAVSRRDWRTLPQDVKVRIPHMETSEIVSEFGVDARTARNWKTYARK